MRGRQEENVTIEAPRGRKRVLGEACLPQIARSLFTLSPTSRSKSRGKTLISYSFIYDDKRPFVLQVLPRVCDLCTLKLVDKWYFVLLI